MSTKQLTAAAATANDILLGSNFSAFEDFFAVRLVVFLAIVFSLPRLHPPGNILMVSIY
jgi:hypothetical protein